MLRILELFLAVGVVTAQQAYGGQNKEYSGLGKYVTILDQQWELTPLDLDKIYGAAVIDSNGETTTFTILPTKLNANQTKFGGDYATVTVGPTTVVATFTETRTYTDMLYTYERSCSFSGTSTAVCISSMGGLPKPCDPGLQPGDGFPGGTFIHTSTYEPRLGFQTYEIVTKTTTIKDTDPVPTKLVSGPFPEEWSAPRTYSITGTFSDCAASSTVKDAIPAATLSSSGTAVTTSSGTSSSIGGSATPSIPSAAGKGREIACAIFIFVAASMPFALL